MRVVNKNLGIAVLGTLILLSTVNPHSALGAADPNSVPPIHASAGGPYSGTVGVPVEFDASMSYLADGNDIEGYYWDWDMSANFECFSLPECTHTWQCAYSGPVRVYIFNKAGDVDWAEAYVNVTGAETALCVALKAAADLHLYDASLRHVGLDYATNGPEMAVPESTYQIVNDAGKRLPLYGYLEDGSVWQEIEFPLYSEGPYSVELVGADEGPFELIVYAYQDGVCVAQESYKADIFAGETIAVDVAACCKDDCLELDCGALNYRPTLKVDPEKIELPVDPATTYEVLLTISETVGRRPLRSVTLSCGDLTGAIHSISGSDVTFDLNGFDVEPGGSQTVLMMIPVPENFLGQVSGAITIDTLDEGVGKTIETIVWKTGDHAPICDPGGPYKGTVGEPITFNASESRDQDGHIAEFCWDWDWDGQFECTSKSTIQHTWDDVFKGTVLLRVVDNEGLISEKSVSVVVEEPEE